jgi:hypothetical protein
VELFALLAEELPVRVAALQPYLPMVQLPVVLEVPAYHPPLLNWLVGVHSVWDLVKLCPLAGMTRPLWPVQKTAAAERMGLS